MDKVLGIFTLLFVGVPLVVMSLLISWGLDDDRRDTTALRGDFDVRLYVPCRCRRRRGNNGLDKGTRT